MSTTTEYLFLFRGTDWDRGMSPAEMQQTMSRFSAWFERLSTEGTVKAGQPLMNESRIVSGRNGGAVTDGPFAESKEAVGGYFLIKADSFDAAVAVAQACPLLEHGTVIEVRPISDECPTLQRVRKTIEEERVLVTA